MKILRLIGEHCIDFARGLGASCCEVASYEDLGSVRLATNTMKHKWGKGFRWWALEGLNL